MSKVICHINNSQQLRLSEDDCEFGSSEEVLTTENNLLMGNEALNRDGYGLIPFLSAAEFADLRAHMTTFLGNKLKEYVPNLEHFSLENYHRHVPSDEVHYAIAGWGMEPQTIGSAFDKIKTVAEELLSTKLGLKSIPHNGQENTYIGYRIVRPGKQDYSPFHRDAWLPYWKDTVNIWLPLCGADENNSLQLIAESHLWPESDIMRTKAGAVINGKTYHISAAIATARQAETVSPILSAGEGLLFSPYILHGNGENRNLDKTRVSIEIRFCRNA